MQKRSPKAPLFVFIEPIWLKIAEKRGFKEVDKLSISTGAENN